MTDDQPVSAAPEQPPIGGFCDDCGHYAARHDETGCQFPRPADNPCKCRGMRWLGKTWPRPWLPAPDGLTKERLAASDPARNCCCDTTTACLVICPVHPEGRP